MFRLGVFIAALALAAPAHSFTALNGKIVEETGPGRFTAGWNGLSGAPSFWCAAGDYVLRGLNLPPRTRIYRYSAPPRPSGAPITFGLSPDGAVNTGLLRLSRNPGISASFARALCDRDRNR